MDTHQQQQHHPEDEERSDKKNENSSTSNSQPSPGLLTGTTSVAGSSASQPPPGFRPPAGLPPPGLPPAMYGGTQTPLGMNPWVNVPPSSAQSTTSSAMVDSFATGQQWDQRSQPRPSSVAVNSQQSSFEHLTAHSHLTESTMTGVEKKENPALKENHAMSVAAARDPDAVLQAEGHPRMKLNERYQRQHQLSLLNTNFISWADTSNGDHAPYWTSLFVCPMTGEIFRSGELVNPGHKGIRHNISGFGDSAINWYGGKKNAEAAAAGRAEDCFRFRKVGAVPFASLTHRFCMELPYAEKGNAGGPPNLPANMPSEYKQRVLDFQKQASQKRELVHPTV
eukprot:CAMPEP_0113478292 /NCGR_PEP_ID=MMETSP0014_2-20120614/20676_1 /TAXON_ID=2857 /ORGANISM="Nitzschia sp." /LENGTH=337 /DNA_ID=CAMNT_0000371469 /DNA_START=51 /DNA_END=1064 /DNA_ORIENTATION=+ /assembly_acc=CAM_ASM_000159